METRKETSGQPATPSKYAGLGAAIAAEIMIVFWFGVGVMLAVGVAEALSHFLEHSREASKAATKMEEQTQLQQVTTKDPKKVEAGKRLAEYDQSSE